MNRTMCGVALVSTLAISGSALASHRWSSYHWSRSSAEITPPVEANLTATWEPYLQVAINGDGTNRGWNYSDYIQSPVGTGSANPKTCKPVAGRIQVCNARYGRNGWLGIAQIWLSSGHITQGATKLNDTYFGTATYNTPAWRRLVMCQEVGHDYGLGHVNENFDPPNTGSCMDYTNDPDGGPTYGLSNEYPNDHDFAELAAIYGSHSETTFAVRVVGQATPAGTPSEAPGGDSPGEWGRAIHYDGLGRPDIFEMTVASGRKKITHVFWAMGEGPPGRQHD